MTHRRGRSEATSSPILNPPPTDTEIVSCHQWRQCGVRSSEKYLQKFFVYYSLAQHVFIPKRLKMSSAVIIS